MTTLRLFIFLLTLTVFYGCEGVVEGTGRVVSSVDDKPLDNVLVIWTNTNDSSCHTDSLGNFKVGGFMGCVPDCPQLQLLFYKPGYKNQYLNLTDKDNRRLENVVVKMEPTNISQSTENPFLSKLLVYINLLVSLFNLVTLIFLFTTKFKYKFLWTLLIIFGSISLHYNFYDNNFNLKTFNFFIQLSLMNLTGLVKTYLLIPLGSGIFWIYRRKKNIA